MSQGNIMIVDDNPDNLKLLEDMLQQRGHEVRSFPRGRLALAAAAKHVPDLILLDINMPEMNGYEVCERLKSNQQLADIPVIFLSALNDMQNKIKAFRSGALDYISKPFQFEEVQARVQTHLKLHNLQRALKTQNEHLEEIINERTRELAEANQRLTILDRSKNEFLSLISHELRTPLNGVLGVAEMILNGVSSPEEEHDLNQAFQESRLRLLSILNDALLLTQIDVNGGQFRCAPVPLHTAVTRAMECASDFSKSRNVALGPFTSGDAMVLGEPDLLVRALQALLETAVKFSEDGTIVRLRHEMLPCAHRVIIESQGKRIPGPVLPKLFEVFSVAEARTPGGDLGLGPSVAHRILSLVGGSVSVTNLEDPSGIRLTASLKSPPQDAIKPHLHCDANFSLL